MILQGNQVEEGEGESKRIVILGGTFDILHKGHKYILKEALKISKKIYIGLVVDELLKNKIFYEKIKSFNERKKAIKNFIKSLDKKAIVKIYSLKDPYGPSIKLKNITDLIVTEETLPRGLMINKIRERKGLRKLRIHVLSLILAEDKRPIRSSRIRGGEINEDGKLLVERIIIS